MKQGSPRPRYAPTRREFLPAGGVGLAPIPFLNELRQELKEA